MAGDIVQKKRGPKFKANLIQEENGIVAIFLNRGMVAQVSAEDYAKVAQCRWTVSEVNDGIVYAMTSVYRDGKRTSLMMHRAVMNLDRGNRQKVDHWDGDGLNNTRGNLRLATTSQNSMNKRKRKLKSSRFKGVSVVKREYNLKRPWKACVCLNGKNRTLGYFATEEEAAEAYNKAAMRDHGDFACLNPVAKPIGS